MKLTRSPVRTSALAAVAVILGWLVTAPLPAAAAGFPTVTAIKSCADLASVDLADIGGAGSKVTSATEIDGNGRSFCAIEGTLSPSIGFRVELPETGWTQRYLQVGCGGLCGMINLDVGAADGCLPVTQGDFVVATTDMGHQGMDPSFGRDPQKRVDFAYRGVHLTSLAAKKLIAAFYGQAEQRAYFTGCSDGGREAVMEALRYPDDFDGIAAGAPAMLFQFQNSLHHAWLALSNTGADGKPIVTAPRLPVLHKAVVAACDGLDGLVDGLISDPRLCHFDPKTIECPADATDASACLTPTEVAAVTKFYEGPVDPATGIHLTVGEEQYGSELAWAGVFVPQTADQPIFSSMIALGALQNLIFAEEPPADYALTDLTFDAATVDLLKARHPLFDATSPDLKPFAEKGGKLILWHGWADPHISPLTTIAFHEAVLKEMGEAAVAGFERLYLLPGVYHCGNGEGMASVDLLTPLMDWVEDGTAPEAVTTRTATEGGNSFGLPTAQKKERPADAPAIPAEPPVTRERPVYPYPALAKYIGGDPNAAASYVKGEPLHTAPTAAWAGEDFFKPYQPAAE